MLKIILIVIVYGIILKWSYRYGYLCCYYDILRKQGMEEKEAFQKSLTDVFGVKIPPEDK